MLIFLNTLHKPQINVKLYLNLFYLSNYINVLYILFFQCSGEQITIWQKKAYYRPINSSYYISILIEMFFIWHMMSSKT